MTKQEPTSWWIFKDLKGDAFKISDERPQAMVVEAPNGVVLGKIEFQFQGCFKVFGRIWPEDSVPNNGQFGVGGEWTLVTTITEITKTEYDTYQAFGLFDD